MVLDWAYGNTDTDLDGYLRAGVVPSHISLVSGVYSGDLRGSNRIDGYAPEVERARCLPPVTQP